MWSGRDALGSINRVISQLHGEESNLDRALQSGMANSERLRQERGRALRELARVKLDELSSGRLVSGLDAGERRAVALIEGRRTRIARAATERDAAAQALEAADAAQEQAAAAVAAVLAELDDLRERTEKAVLGDAAHVSARESVESAIAIAAEARRKVDQNSAELAIKKKPYDEDPLFQYLWTRGFGTATYAHSGLVRFLDRMVASFIGFNDVRANYHMLSEIPLRLGEHAEEREAAVGDARARLASLEAEALVRAGAPELETRLARARTELAAAESTLDKARRDLASADRERDEMMSGTGDTAYMEALSTIAAADEKDSLATLLAETRRTPTNADENIVRQIERIDRDIANADAELAKLRETARNLAERRTEVERTRERFRRSGYDHPHATFGNERVIADVLGGILAGAFKASVLWDTLKGGYSDRAPRSRPDFGGGFPFPIPGAPGSGNNGGGVWGDGWRNPGSAGSWGPQHRDDDDDDHRGGSAWGNGPSRDNDDDNFSTGGRF